MCAPHFLSQHPNLVLLLDVFETDDHLYLVTELMRGGDLFQRLERVTTFSELVAAQLARQIISAVAYLHEHGVVHCDLKPSNILVIEKDEPTAGGTLTVKIADFGLSQSLSVAQGQQQLLTEVCGTPDYFSPELVELAQRQQQRAALRQSSPVKEADAAAALLARDDGEDAIGYGPSNDCWALGCIVYELLAGRPPYQAQDERVLYYKIRENDMEFPADPFASVSPAAVALIQSLSKTEPSERLTCSEALQHAWLTPPSQQGDDLAASEGEGGAAAPTLSTKPLGSDVAKKRRQSLQIRQALQQPQGKGPRGSQTATPAFTELESMRTAQEEADAMELAALMKKMDADEATDGVADAADVGGGTAPAGSGKPP